MTINQWILQQRSAHFGTVLFSDALRSLETQRLCPWFADVHAAWTATVTMYCAVIPAASLERQSLCCGLVCGCAHCVHYGLARAACTCVLSALAAVVSSEAVLLVQADTGLHCISARLGMHVSLDEVL